MYGYENDVAYDNYAYQDYLEKFWSDKLSFIYFTETFWMDHPYCILNKDELSWINNDLLDIAEEFLDYLTTDDKIEHLLDYGIRPYDDDWDSSHVLNDSYGVYPKEVSESESKSLRFPDSDTVTTLQET